VTAETITAVLARRCADLAGRSDADIGGELLGQFAVHSAVDRDTLGRWAGSALAFGRELARTAPRPPELPVTEASGGIEPRRILLAEYRSRPAGVVIHRDAVDRAESLIDELGWRDWYPAGCVRAAAIAHETAHQLLHGPAASAAKPCAAISAAPTTCAWTVHAHVVGAAEMAAHGFAAEAAGLPRTPVLLTAALGELAAGIRLPAERD
jgi:hypothetical protein